MNELQVVKHQTTSDMIRELKSQLPDGNMTLKQLLNFYDGKQILIIILVAPFLLPASIPGSSTPFGVLIILLALTEIFNKQFYLPKFVANYEISHQSVKKLFDILIKFLGYIEKIVKPRGEIAYRNYIHKFNLVICIFLALLLFLPLPIPFTDFFPALSILLLIVSNIEHDSYLMILAYISTFGTLFYFYKMGSLGIGIIQKTIEYLFIYIQ